MPASAWPDETIRFDLRTPDAHRLHVRQCGPQHGEPWLVLHGGPGSGCQPAMAAWFDPLRHRVVLPDQRGAGHSAPAGTRRRNTVPALLADLEQLRKTLGIERWGVVGGSWGAALAVAYADRFPQAVSALVLRGTFLTGFDDVQALFNARGAGRALLRGTRRMGQGLPGARGRLVVASRLLQRGTPVQKLNIAAQWQQAERRLLRLPPARRARPAQQKQMDTLRKYQIQAHYLMRRAGLGKPALLAAAARIGARGLPVTLLHGQDDNVCRPANARRVQAVIPQARLVWVPGGHLAVGKMVQALRAAIRSAGGSVAARQAAGLVDLAVDRVA
ncbi:alpha/beta hydrolase [Ralstonia mannitolilytica]|uniref:Proline iminopeptidase n=1 Tax=Ralstonia mannitolilytica TaxID=105219 RepID=A0AAJ4ZJM7_9RALS|nr:MULTISPECIES: alpha/beta fold hydrolase [Ralstonia]MBU9578043.1 alpha/beta hydrolase [Ralstonia mannitolilytica]PLT19756.1 prolyl aminopeptidase [Ralstonia mannitolilytica]CAG2140884.1 Proline iminopeptidase [Ralstonia mannitolilytica]CAJ0730091.1 Proline iminopeptidase [Ralstonia mannitolilytica]SUD87061.1 Proline iminopeptidase [Ralstonia mannitolilytica]